MYTSSTRTGGRDSGTSTSDVPILEQRPQPAECVIHQVRNHERAGLRLQATRFDAAQVQQVGDQPVEALRLAIDGCRRIVLVLWGPADTRVHEAPGRRADGGQWRAKVVRYGVEQGGFERVTAAGDLRTGRLDGQLVTLEGLTDLVGRGRQQARLELVRHQRASRQNGPDGAELVPGSLDLDAERLAVQLDLTGFGRARALGASGSAPTRPVDRRGAAGAPDRTAGIAGTAPVPVSAATRMPLAALAERHPRPVEPHLVAQSTSRICGSAPCVSRLVASARLMRNSEVASRSRRDGQPGPAGAGGRPAGRPRSPTTSSRTRFEPLARDPRRSA